MNNFADIDNATDIGQVEQLEATAPASRRAGTISLYRVNTSSNPVQTQSSG